MNLFRNRLMTTGIGDTDMKFTLYYKIISQTKYFTTLDHVPVRILPPP